MKASEVYLQSLPPESAELQYHGFLWKVIQSIRYDSRDELVGLGLVQFLAEAFFSSPEIPESSVYACGQSYYEASIFVSYLFHHIEPSSSVWHARSLEGDPKIRQWHQWWHDRFSESEYVTSVI